MLTRRLSLIAVAAAFAVSSSAAMLQSARPALADADDHHPRVQQRHDGDHDRDDRKRQTPAHNGNGYWSNGQWHAGNQNGYRSNGNNQNRNWSYNRNPNGTWNNGNHNGQKKHRDRDHDHDRR